MTDTNALFQPFSLGRLTVRSRIVMAPMTRTFSPGGVPGESVAAYYRRRAEADVGLILSEGTTIDRPGASNHPAIPHFHGREALDGWKRVIDGVHAAGGRMGPQIWHVGNTVNPSTTWEPEGIESPSGLLDPARPRGRAMTEEDIADTIAAYGRAAAEARRLGFDVVEIHGAHGYLIDEFFWDGTNRRADRWGGPTIAERGRFGAEVVRAVKAAAGPDLPVIIRVSQFKQQDYAARLARTPKELESWLLPLVEAGADVIHASQRRFWEPEFPEIDGDEGLNLAGWAKKVTGAATISVGSVGLSGDLFSAFAGQSSSPTSLDALVERMERGDFDLIAVGRALLSDPLWARKVRNGDTAGLKDFAPSAMAELV